MNKPDLLLPCKIYLLRGCYLLATIFILLPASLNFILLSIATLVPLADNSVSVFFKIFLIFPLYFLYCAWAGFFSLWLDSFSKWKPFIKSGLYLSTLVSLLLLIYNATFTNPVLSLFAYSLSAPVQFLLFSFLYLYFMKKLSRHENKDENISDNTINKKKADFLIRISIIALFAYTTILVVVLASLSISTLFLYGMETASSLLMPDRFANWVFILLCAFPALVLFFLLINKNKLFIPDNTKGDNKTLAYSIALPVLGLLFFITLYFSAKAPENKNVNSENLYYQNNFSAHQYYKIYQAFPLAYASKGWHANKNLKNYFDAQRNILKHMIRPDIHSPAERPALRLAAGGDLLRMPLPQQNSIDKGVLDYLSGFDLLTANLETLISAQYPVPPKSLFNMNSNPEIVHGFRDAQGKNLLGLVSLANNHIFDYPDNAIEDSLRVLQAENINFHGIGFHDDGNPDSYKNFTVLEINGLRIGYHAASSFVNKTKNLARSKMQLSPLLNARLRPVDFYKQKSFEEIDLQPITSVLKEMAAAQVDLKILSLHWGREHMFYPDPVQIDIAHALASAGADVIIGSHPHVIQPAEICFINNYEDRLDKTLANTIKDSGCRLQDGSQKARKSMIFYSLGNLRSYSFSFWQQVAVIAELALEKNGGGDNGYSDWHLQGFSFYYDKQQQGLNGERILMPLDDYLFESASKSNSYFATQAQRHLLGEQLTTCEENKMLWLSFIDSVQRLISAGF